MWCQEGAGSGPLLDLEGVAQRRQLARPPRITVVAPQDLFDGGSGASPDRLQLRDGLPPPHDREPLPPVLDRIKEVGEATSRLRGTDFGHEIRLSDPIAHRSPVGESGSGRQLGDQARSGAVATVRRGWRRSQVTGQVASSGPDRRWSRACALPGPAAMTRTEPAARTVVPPGVRA